MSYKHPVLGAEVLGVEAHNLDWLDQLKQTKIRTQRQQPERILMTIVNKAIVNKAIIICAMAC